MQESSSTPNPITSLCIVVDPNKCPPNFELLLKSNDRKDDCDLWKDGVFKSKVTRYLCYSRVASTFDIASSPREVLADLVIQNDKELPPPGFRVIDKTIDTCEKATNKKQISVKMLPVSATTDAVNEIVILSKSKRAPPGYTSAGDVNGLLLCFKMSKIKTTGDTAAAGMLPAASNSEGQMNNGQHSTETYAVNWWGIPSPYQPRIQNTAYTHYSVQERGSESSSGFPHFDGSSSFAFAFGSTSAPLVPPSSQAQVVNSQLLGNNSGPNPLCDVPFRVNPKFAEESMLIDLHAVPTVTYKSLMEIENEFNYAFNLENSTVSQARI